MTVSTTVSSINVSADQHDEMAATSQQAVVNEQEKDSKSHAAKGETDNRAKLPSNGTEEKCNHDDKTPASGETHTSCRKVTPSKYDDQAREFYFRMTRGGDIDESTETYMARFNKRQQEHDREMQELSRQLEERKRQATREDERRERETSRLLAEAKQEYEQALEQLRFSERLLAETEEHSTPGSPRSQENVLLVQEFLEYRGRQQRNQEMLVPCEEHELMRPSKRSRM